MGLQLEPWAATTAAAMAAEDTVTFPVVVDTVTCGIFSETALGPKTAKRISSMTSLGTLLDLRKFKYL